MGGQRWVVRRRIEQGFRQEGCIGRQCVKDVFADRFFRRERFLFDIDRVLTDVEAAVRPFPKAGLFELAEEGYGSPFELLVACIISIRTLDEVMMPCSRQLFERARTPSEMCALEEKLPRRHWVDINRLLVPFGKHVCTGSAPRCSTCPIVDVCEQVGVGRSR